MRGPISGHRPAQPLGFDITRQEGLKLQPLAAHGTAADGTWEAQLALSRQEMFLPPACAACAGAVTVRSRTAALNLVFCSAYPHTSSRESSGPSCPSEGSVGPAAALVLLATATGARLVPTDLRLRVPKRRRPGLVGRHRGEFAPGLAPVTRGPRGHTGGRVRTRPQQNQDPSARPSSRSRAVPQSEGPPRRCVARRPLP